MAIIKSYTNIEQSKKLAEILPLESADMEYILEQWIDEKTHRHKEEYCEIPVVKVDDDSPLQLITHPCWSLAALLRVIPKRIKGYNVLRMDMDEESFAIWYDTIGFGVNSYLPDITSESAVDACYEMIIKLHELNLL